jgi:hypothetical protein
MGCSIVAGYLPVRVVDSALAARSPVISPVSSTPCTAARHATGKQTGD